jgi:hypothetical protein
VPLKLTSMNFELMSGLPMPLGAQQGGGSAGGAASSQLLGSGLPPAPHSAGSLNGHGGSGSGGGHGDGGGGGGGGGGGSSACGRGGTYFPMSAPHEDFLRPAREQQRPPRPSDPRAAPRRGASGYVVPAPRDPPGRRSSPAPPPRHSH